jgi:endogenous inhibitor of DNA gyrase (YacG/DUF329 family)
MAPTGQRITIDCPHCKRFFLEQASAVYQGASIRCPTCARDIALTSDSPFESVRKALHEGRKARLAEK